AVAKGGPGQATADIGDSSGVQLGDKVVAVGNAGGRGGLPSVATGKVTGLSSSITATNEGDGTSERLVGVLQTNANIHPGDSGGPLLNRSGEVVGIKIGRAPVSTPVTPHPPPLTLLPYPTLFRSVGNAGGRGGLPSVATGKVTGLSSSITATNEGDGTSERLVGVLQTNANIQPGDSGGPLLNRSGEVVGI